MSDLWSQLDTSVARTARRGGYVLLGSSDRVWRRCDDRPGDVEPASAWVDIVVHELWAAGELTLGETEHVTCRDLSRRGEHAEPACAITIVAGSPCPLCAGRGCHPVSGQARWSPEKGVYRPTGTTPCPRCQPDGPGEMNR